MAEGNDNTARPATGMTFSRKVLAGLAAGIAAGLFLGELVAPLGVVAEGFVKLLQMTVLPYVTVSIVVGLGSLDATEAKRTGLLAGAAMASLWVVGIGFAFLFPLTFPPAESASFFSSSLVEKAPPFDFISLYVPSNPFHSLANNIVPAVVVFSVILGLALIGIERKAVLLDVLGVVSATLARATSFVVRLTPYGLFALSATAVGTLPLEQLQRLQVYLVTYAVLSLLVALWVLPGLVAALTPIPHRQVLTPTRDALITAFVAADLFIVLPVLIEASKALLVRHGVTDRRSAGLPDVIVPASFNFPHTGKLLSISFVLFAAWFAGAALPVTRYPQLALTGLLTFFGSLNAAVPFLLDLFRIPADTFELFVATGVINSRFGTLTAAVHTVAVALLGSAAIAGRVRFEPRRLLRYGITTLVLTALAVGGLRLAFRTLLYERYRGAEVVYGMTNALVREPSRVVEGPQPAEPAAVPVLEGIRSRGALRVGFVPERLPFVFHNARQELVGLETELAHLLGRDLGVRVEFLEHGAEDVADAVARGDVDIAIGGIPVTPQLAARSLLSEPYLDETLSFVVKDHLRTRFETWASIQEARDLVIGVPPLPYYEQMLRARLPGLSLKTLVPGRDPLDASAGLDAVALPAERGSVLTLLNPGWTVVVPQPGVIKVPLAFPLARHDQAWASFVNTWIAVKRRDGTVDTLYAHWILGRNAQAPRPRWSVVRNVLGWVE